MFYQLIIWVWQIDVNVNVSCSNHRGLYENFTTNTDNTYWDYKIVLIKDYYIII